MSRAAVLFDMDGVVVDSERHWAALENERILPETVEGQVTAAEIAGMNVRDLYAHLEAEHGTTVTESEFVARYDAAAETVYTERAELLPRFPALLARLRERGPVGLVSSSPPRWIELVTDRFALSFDAVVSVADIDGPGKPAPDVYRHAASVLGVTPENCVAVEDSAHGVAAAVAAGMDCIGYRGTEGQDLSAATAIAATPADLRTHLLDS